MTLIIAAEDKNRVIIGSDTKGLVDYGGIRAERNIEEKIIQVSKHVCIAFGGNIGLATQFVEEFKQTLSSRDDGISKISEMFRKFCVDEYSKILPRSEKVDFGFLITGLDKDGKKYKKPKTLILESYNSFYPSRFKRYGTLGIDIIAQYLFSKNYDTEHKNGRLPNLIAQSIYDTSRCDSNVGSKIKMYIIESDGAREVSSSDISRIYKDWETQDLETILLE